MEELDSLKTESSNSSQKGDIVERAKELIQKRGQQVRAAAVELNTQGS